MNIDIDNLPLDDQPTWDLISSGETIGCFQIESRLGRQTCKQVKPQNIKELADVVALIRPSCLEAKLEDGNNFVWHYTERKFGREHPHVLHEALRDILEPTQGLLLYQEQSIKIGSEIGGMDLAQADQLIRKGLGKKLPEVVAKAKKVFLEGNKRLKKVSDEDALTIFEYLEKGQRYQFNLSHSISYAHLSYVTAYLKTHYPLRFYRSYLDHAKDKQKPLEEINKLVESARRTNIQICNPDIRRRNSSFAIEENKIFFGLSSIKGIGARAVEDILRNTPKDIPDNWTYVLFNILLNNKKSIVKSLIAVGALDFLEPTRDQMLYEHEQVLHLSARETKYIQDNFENLRTDDPAEVLYSLCDLGSGKNTGIANVSRLSIIKGLAYALEHPMYSLQDSIKKIASYEESYLGISLSCSKFDLLDRSQANATCDEFNKDVKVNNILIFGQVVRINDFVNKDGQEMMFFDLKDDTDEISVLVRPQMYDQVSRILKKMRLYKVGGFKKRNTLTLTYCEEIYE